MNRDSDAEARRHPAGPGGPGAGGPTPPADDRTRQIPRVEPGGPPVSRQQVAQPVPAATGPRAPQPGWHAAETQPIPAVLPEPGLDQAAEQAAEQTRVLRPTCLLYTSDAADE